MIAAVASTLLVGLTTLGVISEPVQLAIIALIGGAVTGLIGSVVTPLVLYLIKRQEDRDARQRLHDSIAENTALTKTVEVKADAAYKEANNVNVKLESIGIQTKPQRGDSAENSIHVTLDHQA